MATQRQFKTLGNTVFKISQKLIGDFELCRLLKYSDTRETASCPTFDPVTLLNNNIRLIPQLPDVDETGAFVVVLLEEVNENETNPEFKFMTLRFDIIVPYEDWLKVDETLKPFAIMERIDVLFNGQRVSGLGKLKFATCLLKNWTDTMGGYTMVYTINEFN